MNFNAFFAASATLGATASEYADLRVPVVNMILEGLSLVLLLGAIVAGILILRNHVREWLFPFGIGLVFHLVFRYMLFNQQFGLMRVLFTFLMSKVPFFQEHVVILNEALILLEFVATILAILLGLAYWKKTAVRDHRLFSVGGAISFGFSAYVVMLLSSGYLLQIYNVISQSRMINESGFDTVLKSYLSANTGVERQVIIDSLVSLTDTNPELYIQFVLISLTLIFDGFVPIAMSVIRYGVISGAMEKKWNAAVIGLPLLMMLPAAIFQLNEGIAAAPYIAFGYALVLAAGSVILTVFVSRTYMEAEWRLLGHTRKMEKKEKEAEKNKMPKIVMPKD